jgi:hypothetical protein
MRLGWYWIFVQAVPDDLAARLASTPRLSTGQMPSGSLTLGYRQPLMVMRSRSRPT